MPIIDIFLVVTWWSILFVIGAAAFPLTKRLFGSWWDHGYLLSKAVGLASVTYGVWILGSFHLLPFYLETIIFVVGALFFGGIALAFIDKRQGKPKSKVDWKRIIALELLFLLALFFWSFVKAHEPDIHGLEKFMDYGFSQSILQSDYFPPPDMWYAGGTINYYYFGHTMQALLSRFSGIDMAYGYNLMLATLFALCFTMSFGIGVQLYKSAISYQLSAISKRVKRAYRFWAIISGLLTAFLVSLSGNMQTIYAFTKGYSGEDTPPPFWTILWPMAEFVAKLPEGTMRYWYANATRFIPFTIHEFPGYSFVVSDNHGHVLGIPFTLLMIASLLMFFGFRKNDGEKSRRETVRQKAVPFVLFGWLTGILFMTNALDGPIYLGLFGLLFLLRYSSNAFFSWEWIKEKGTGLIIVMISFVLTTLPFLLTFKSFATGLALNCPPAFLANSRIGPFIFETVDKCQRSPFWMMLLLWGFFWFCGVTYIVVESRKSKVEREQHNGLRRTLMTIFFYCVGLILFAEVFYFKDIYPAHFRSNTMFKLGYQAFMMSSMLSGLVIVKIMSSFKLRSLEQRWMRRIFLILVVPQLFLVSIFPYFSIR